MGPSSHGGHTVVANESRVTPMSQVRVCGASPAARPSLAALAALVQARCTAGSPALLEYAAVAGPAWLTIASYMLVTESMKAGPFGIRCLNSRPKARKPCQVDQSRARRAGLDGRPASASSWGR